MERLQGLLGIIAILAVIYVLSSSRKNIKWRTIGVGLVLQVVFCFLVLAWEPGFKALKGIANGLTKLTEFTNEGTQFVFGGLFGDDFVFALNVLPVIIFLGAIIAALYYLGLSSTSWNTSAPPSNGSWVPPRWNRSGPPP